MQAILDASIQVLLGAGLGRLTTTRVAERAGFSVGTLYQYFPNKQSLLAAVSQRHLERVLAHVEATLAPAKGQGIDAIAQAIAHGFVDAKLQDAETSCALYALVGEPGAAEVLARVTQRFQLVLCDALASATDARWHDLQVVSLVLSTAMAGPVQALLMQGAPKVLAEQVRRHLASLVRVYLKSVAVRPT